MKSNICSKSKHIDRRVNFSEFRELFKISSETNSDEVQDLGTKPLFDQVDICLHATNRKMINMMQ